MRQEAHGGADHLRQALQRDRIQQSISHNFFKKAVSKCLIKLKSFNFSGSGGQIRLHLRQTADRANHVRTKHNCYFPFC